jgi:hypothetical protein
MWNSLIDSDESNQVFTAWIAKEELRSLLALARTGAYRNQIRQRRYAFYYWCATADIDELTPWPAPSKPGGPPSKPSSIPASPTPAPKGSTGSSSR